MRVVVTAPAAFRFTYPADPGRHEEAARLLGGSGTGRDVLAETIVALSRDVGIPNGLTPLGYTEADLDGLVAGAMKQQRLLAISPRDVSAADVRQIFGDSLRNW